MKAKQGNERFSLSRWSRRKLEAATKPASHVPTVSASASGAPATGASAGAAPVAGAAPELPPVESLSFDSDFSVFLRPGVDAEVRQAALKKLLRDPRFNVMDGLDTYIDDYTKPDPIAPDVLADLLKRGFGGGEAEPAAAPLANGPMDTPATDAQPTALANASSASPATEAQPAALGATPAESATLAASPSEESAAPASSAEEERGEAPTSQAQRDVSRPGGEGQH